MPAGDRDMLSPRAGLGIYVMSAESNLVCWKCGFPLETVLLPFRRLEVCPECDAELHVCRMCKFYDPHVVEACVEDSAEEVRNKERANFCDYFKPAPGAYQSRDSAASQASRAKLDALFSQATTAGDSDAVSTRRALDDFFTGDSDEK